MSRTRKSVSMISKADAGQSSNWDFPVFQEELITGRGVKSGIHAVVRGDTGAVIGQYSGEKLLPNTELVGAFEGELSRLGLSFNRSFLTTGGGARFYGRYELGEMGVNGEKFKQVLTLENSYDRSLLRAYSFEAMRVLCLNGMVGLGKVAGTREKHSLEFDIQSWVVGVGDVIANGAKSATKAIDIMSSVKLDDSKARNVLSNLVTASRGQGMSERSALLINSNWENPAIDEVPLGDTLYRLYNAATRYTRDVAKVGRFELSQKSAAYIGGAFDCAIERGQIENLFKTPVAPIDFDAVTVSNN